MASDQSSSTTPPPSPCPRRTAVSGAREVLLLVVSLLGAPQSALPSTAVLQPHEPVGDVVIVCPAPASPHRPGVGAVSAPAAASR